LRKQTNVTWKSNEKKREVKLKREKSRYRTKEMSRKRSVFQKTISFNNNNGKEVLSALSHQPGMQFSRGGSERRPSM